MAVNYPRRVGFIHKLKIQRLFSYSFNEKEANYLFLDLANRKIFYFPEEVFSRSVIKMRVVLKVYFNYYEKENAA